MRGQMSPTPQTSVTLASGIPLPMSPSKASLNVMMLPRARSSARRSVAVTGAVSPPACNQRRVRRPCWEISVLLFLCAFLAFQPRVVAFNGSQR